MLGPTGAGKTTLLRTIAGLEPPDAGTITMAGRDVTAFDPASRDVALVFQNFSLYPALVGAAEPGVPAARARPQPPRSRDRDAASRGPPICSASRAIWIARRPGSPGGEMQRVAIGRAIVRRPRLFLMDEPLTNLDAKLREALRVELVELRRELKTPMVFVTHDQAEALSMADRIVVLSEGRILQTGAPREIYERPVSPVVALQLGQPAINLLPVRREGGQWRAADGTPLMRAEPSGADERLLGVRPEDVALLGGEAASEAVVRVVEQTGPTTTLLVDWLGSRVHIVVPRRAAVRPGDRLHPRIDPARAVLFEQTSKESHDRTSVRTEVHEDERPHRGAAGAHAPPDPRRGSGPRHRGLAGVRARARLPEHPDSRPRCTPPRPTCRPRRCSTRSRTRSTCASPSTRRAPSACSPR